MLLGYAFTLEEALPPSERALLRQARCEKVFVDTIDDLKGSLGEREAALDALRSGHTLVVPRLWRLGRSLRELARVARRLKEKNAGLWSVAEDLDTRRQNGGLVFKTIQAFSGFRDGRAQRYAEVVRSRSRREESGGGSGRGRPPALGEEDIRLAQDLLDRSVPVKQICEVVGVSRATFYRYLSPDGERRAYARGNGRPSNNTGAEADNDDRPGS